MRESKRHGKTKLCHRLWLQDTIESICFPVHCVAWFVIATHHSLLVQSYIQLWWQIMSILNCILIIELSMLSFTLSFGGHIVCGYEFIFLMFRSRVAIYSFDKYNYLVTKENLFNYYYFINS